ncbi:MAG: S41 family peptidase [Chloroflexi bacterium]|nr:S41 family peptidase [Chloroflexota bacterium]MCY3697584.1 S41 family peptidase [Chloroflexota bacterium]MXX81366.1 S41 family peptidase [Chloroflexota bacterium]MYF22765.1 S41 family peptidase [Chloroflexota bacterium]
MSELRWDPPAGGEPSRRAVVPESSNGSDGPGRGSIALLIFVMIGAAFALGIGVMRVIDASDDYGQFLRSSRDGSGPAGIPAAVQPAGGEDEQEDRAEAAPGRESRFALLDEIVDVLDREFVEPARFESLDAREAAINGILDALGDEHTVFIDAERYRLGSEDIGGSFEGIGATVNMVDGAIIIVRPFNGSPAQESGLRPGDIILEVNGESTEGWSLEQAVAVIRGPRGTDVELLVRHADGEEELIVVTRDRIVVPSVESLPITDRSGQPVADIGYILISQFTERTRDELIDLLDAASNAGLDQLIIDLRGNPGGLLRATVQTTGEFMDEGIVLRQIDRLGEEEIFRDSAGGAGLDLQLVLLINEGSASGAEVMAAALRDQGRAVLIGTKTTGKGTVNIPRQLSDGSVLYVSIARYLTPDSEPVEGVGIAPDIEIALPDTGFEAGQDIQLFVAIEYLRGEYDPSAGAENQQESGPQEVSSDDEGEGEAEQSGGGASE